MEQRCPEHTSAQVLKTASVLRYLRLLRHSSIRRALRCSGTQEVGRLHLRHEECSTIESLRATGARSKGARVLWRLGSHECSGACILKRWAHMHLRR